MPWIEIGSLADFPLGQAREVVAGDRIVAVLRGEEQLTALDGICPHQGGPLGQGELQGCVLTCPWHGWQFDAGSGQSLLSPAVRQPTIPIQVNAEGIVQVCID